MKKIEDKETFALEKKLDEVTMNLEKETKEKFLLAPMGVLAPGSAHA